MDDPNILDLDSLMLLEIETFLENKSTRESFLKVVPSEIFNYASIQLMDNEAYRYHMTHARWLLWHLSSKGVKASEFCLWLGRANLQKALMILKRDVPIQIIEQPPSIICVQKGSKLLLSVQASSFPLPEFQWFKDSNKLLSYQDPDLFIPEVKADDIGVYHCLVTKLNTQTNDVSWVYTDPVHIVLEETFHKTLNSDPLDLSFVTDTCMYASCESVESEINYSDQNNASENEANQAKIIIKRQPYVRGKIAQGMSVCLHCEAECLTSTGKKLPVKYQWYKNRKILEGAITHELQLKNLYPDLDTGDMKWEYFCEVFNNHDKEMSQSAVVELTSADSTTPYYASAKYAFMIANDTYDHLEKLKTPAHDVSIIGKKLESMNFKVYAYKNLALTEMKNAFCEFCKILEKNCYVLFYFAGHGFEQLQMYLQPVDCRDYYIIEESISLDFVLEKLQQKMPALNVLLIDACRKPPPPPPSESAVKLDNTFEGLMKNNTIYGYSTPKFYSSYESDSQPYSFYVKYLEKYITHNKSIQEILRQVQRDFEGDRTVKGVQFPVITTSLSGDRKLCDQINGSRQITSITHLEYIKGCNPEVFEIPSIKSKIILETNASFDIFLNEIVITVYILTEESAPKKILQIIEVNLISDTPEVEMLPSSGYQLKNASLNLGGRSELLKKRVSGIQRIKEQSLNGRLLLNFVKFEQQIESNFQIDVKEITDLKLFVNNLGSLKKSPCS